MKFTNSLFKYSCVIGAIFLFGLTTQLKSQLPITMSYNWRPPFPVPERVNNYINFWGQAHFYPGPPYIEYNLNSLRQWNVSQEVMVWTRVHEHGHIVNRTNDEGTTDCWAAKQLARTDPQILQSAIAWIENKLGNVKIYDGSNGRERAAWMRTCSAGLSPNKNSRSADNSSGDTDDTANSTRGNRRTISRPEKPGNRVSGVGTDSDAEESIDFEEEEVEFDDESGYLKYDYLFRNTGSRKLLCKVYTAVELKDEITRKIIVHKWNVDEKKFELDPNKTKRIKGKVGWRPERPFFSRENLTPASDYDVQCVFKN